MKTQLLEDIGQSATLSLVPSGKVANFKSQQKAPDLAPVKPRAESGVWRQKPAGEPVEIAVQQPDQPAMEPVANVEAQHVPPDQVHEPAPQGPVFDFTLPSPTAPSPDLFIHEPTWFERSGRSYLLWSLFLLLGALIFQGGWWLYGERKNASSMAVVAHKSKAEPQLEKVVKPRVTNAKEFTLSGDGTVQVTPAAPAVPPLVLLDPAPTPAAKIEPVAEQAPPPAPVRRMRLTERQPARERAPERVVQAEKKPASDTGMAATLKACREHGYHETQCVKRGCSMTKYGFVCRGK